MRAIPQVSAAVGVALAGSVAFGLCATTDTPARASSCMPVPQAISRMSMLASGGRPTVRVGGVVYVVRIEPEKYSGSRFPAGFPWLRATGSNRRVLAPVRLCPPGASTLPITVGAFRAVGPGQATIVAALAPKWRARRTGLHGFRAIVTVIH